MMKNEIECGPAPPSVVKNIKKMRKIKEYVKKKKKEARERVIRERDTEKYLVIVFRSRDEKNALLRKLGLPENERYLAASTLKIERNESAEVILGKYKSSPPHKSGSEG